VQEGILKEHMTLAARHHRTLTVHCVSGCWEQLLCLFMSEEKKFKATKSELSWKLQPATLGSIGIAVAKGDNNAIETERDSTSPLHNTILHSCNSMPVHMVAAFSRLKFTTVYFSLSASRFKATGSAGIAAAAAVPVRDTPADEESASRTNVGAGEVAIECVSAPKPALHRREEQNERSSKLPTSQSTGKTKRLPVFELATAIPLSRLLLETDSPDQLSQTLPRYPVSGPIIPADNNSSAGVFECAAYEGEGEGIARGTLNESRITASLLQSDTCSTGAEVGKGFPEVPAEIQIQTQELVKEQKLVKEQEQVKGFQYNEPALLRWHCMVVADALGMHPSVLAATTFRNTKAAFSLSD
jgi:Tat protein secretion system quality control protein TatD with DNase activity